MRRATAPYIPKTFNKDPRFNNMTTNKKAGKYVNPRFKNLKPDGTTVEVNVIMHKDVYNLIVDILGDAEYATARRTVLMQPIPEGWTKTDFTIHWLCQLAWKKIQSERQEALLVKTAPEEKRKLVMTEAMRRAIAEDDELSVLHMLNH